MSQLARNSTCVPDLFTNLELGVEKSQDTVDVSIPKTKTELLSARERYHFATAAGKYCLILLFVFIFDSLIYVSQNN